MPSLRTTATTVASLALGAVAYGTFIERRWYRVRRETLTGVLRHPAGRPLRVLLVADLHLSPPDQPLVSFIADLAQLEFDLVVAGGDLVGREGAETATADALAPLVADGTPGVVVLGSNDLYGPVPKSPSLYFTSPGIRRHGARLDTDALRGRLESDGWRVLVDERTVVTTGAGPVEIAGLLDPHLPWATLPPAERVAAQDGDAVARVGIVHAPYSGALDLLAGAGYDLLLSGHTHGGQVRIPGLGALVTNCDLPTSRARGSSRWPSRDGREVWLHVSAGVGQSRFAPFRFACRPEASLLELR